MITNERISVKDRLPNAGECPTGWCRLFNDEEEFSWLYRCDEGHPSDLDSPGIYGFTHWAPE